MIDSTDKKGMKPLLEKDGFDRHSILRLRLIRVYSLS